MRIKHKNKRGFTLLEMMLSVAIINIVSGCLWTLIVAIKDSYISTYNSDDSCDYAMLYAQGLENSVLAATQQKNVYAKNDTISWRVGTNSGNVSLLKTLTHAGSSSTTPVFTMTMNKVYSLRQDGSHANVDKWIVKLTYELEGSYIKYHITVTDNYYDPGHVKCVYDGGFWLPHNSVGPFSVGKTVEDNDTLTFKFS